MDTPFLTHRFLIKSQNQIDKLTQCGVKELDIDPSRGLDIEDSDDEKSFPETISGTDTSPHEIPSTSLDSQTPEERIAHLPPTLQGKPLTNELSSMKEVRQHMLESVRGLLGNVRTSGVVEGQQVKEVTQSIISQTLDHEDACVALIRTREFSTDLYDHSLSVGTLAVLLGRLVGFDEFQLRTWRLRLSFMILGFSNYLRNSPERKAVYRSRSYSNINLIQPWESRCYEKAREFHLKCYR